ncbi:uncharacterized protein AMSG_11746 [Thecamonas trahens ATCC 50062]|uniref:EF-hand domain-containing protein n=1 Tax=Thecamonas trahens ATCC 50062 TaxID=461836 RepID=A0A0L0D304_THETB|nr:hypothetical protein AMSG_11746 [Thecamonas trahens ATCC 50062]KNC46679.1 hypothetical protein AMSG_11746 [Thecamonas trahens ATCC 50062]|eukprot:XP_013760495.1 hypothetical protein AMSG_11746 [Thecamonas trahens ATCC 50062]
MSVPESAIVDILTSPIYRSVSSKAAALAHLFASSAAPLSAALAATQADHAAAQASFTRLLAALDHDPSMLSRAASASPPRRPRQPLASPLAGLAPLPPIAASLSTPALSPSSSPSPPRSTAASPEPSLTLSLQATPAMGAARCSELVARPRAGVELRLGDGSDGSGSSGLHLLVMALLASDQAALALLAAQDCGVFDVVTYYSGGLHLDSRAYEGRMDRLPVETVFDKIFYDAVVSSALDGKTIEALSHQLDTVSPVRALLKAAGLAVTSKYEVLSPGARARFATSAQSLAPHCVPVIVHGKAEGPRTEASITYTNVKVRFHAGAVDVALADGDDAVHPLHGVIIALVASDAAQLDECGRMLSLPVGTATVTVSAPLVRDGASGMLELARVRTELALEFKAETKDNEAMLRLLRGEVLKRSPVRLVLAAAGVALTDVWTLTESTSSMVGSGLAVGGPAAGIAAAYDPFSIADAETRRRIHAAFVKCDSDGSSFIDRSEFRQLAYMMGVLLTESELDAALAAIDLDNDAQISEAEFAKWWLAGMPGFGAAGPDESGLALGHQRHTTDGNLTALKLKLSSQVFSKQSSFVLRSVRSAASELELERAAERRAAADVNDDMLGSHLRLRAGPMARAPPASQRSMASVRLVCDESEVAPHCGPDRSEPARFEVVVSVRAGLGRADADTIADELCELLALALLPVEDVDDPQVTVRDSTEVSSGLVLVVSIGLPATKQSMMVQMVLKQLQIRELHGEVECSQRPGGPKAEPAVAVTLDAVASDMALHVLGRVRRNGVGATWIGPVIEALRHASVTADISLAAPADLADCLPLGDGDDSDNESDDESVDEGEGESNRPGAGRASSIRHQLRKLLKAKNLWATLADMLMPFFDKLHAAAGVIDAAMSSTSDSVSSDDDDDGPSIADAMVAMHERLQGLVAARLVIGKGTMLEVTCRNFDIFGLFPTASTLHEYRVARRNRASAAASTVAADCDGGAASDDGLYWGEFGVRSFKVTLVGPPKSGKSTLVAARTAASTWSRAMRKAGTGVAAGVSPPTKVSCVVDGEPVYAHLWETPGGRGEAASKQRTMAAINTDVFVLVCDGNDEASLQAALDMWSPQLGPAQASAPFVVAATYGARRGRKAINLRQARKEARTAGALHFATVDLDDWRSVDELFALATEVAVNAAAAAEPISPASPMLPAALQ